MKGISELYIKRAGLIGFFYCAVPATAWMAIMLAIVPFRTVYLLRYALCLVVGGAIGAHLNRTGIQLWVGKHRGPTGPATVWEGTLTGAAIGIGIGFLPSLVSLIGTNHPEQAKTFIIVATGAAAVIGGLIGTVVAAAGRKYVER
jgi:CDP-diglyceride synthetase